MPSYKVEVLVHSDEFNDAHSIYLRSDAERQSQARLEPFIPKEEVKALEVEEEKLKVLQQVFCMTATDTVGKEVEEQSRSESNPDSTKYGTRRRNGAKVTLKPLYGERQMGKRRYKHSSRAISLEQQHGSTMSGKHADVTPPQVWDGSAAGLLGQVADTLDLQRTANYAVTSIAHSRN